MRIALDAVGGDHAPGEVVAGAALAARELGTQIVLVGPRDLISAELDRQRLTRVHESGLLIPEIVDAPDIVGMDEHPLQAMRRKPNSSLNIGLHLLNQGAVDGFVSAGNSGAVMASALFGLGRVAGIERPALASVFPTQSGQCLLVDVGANADCRAVHLVHFALMGARYAELVLGVKDPSVGLLSNGEEESKGSQLVVEAHGLLKAQKGLRFVGNVEGKDIPAGLVDVVVCDGFVGNVAIKLAEGIGELVFTLLREEVVKSKLAMAGAWLMRPALRRIKRRASYEEYGGAPLLGVNGVVIIAHGRSSARAIHNAVRVAAQAAESGLVARIGQAVLA